jgi:cob(I)alamin adenosyltransferase
VVLEGAVRLKQGYVQVYTGAGKGKTTAALGQALRSVGRGCTVVMVQFQKSFATGEVMAAARLAPEFKIYRFEKPKNFFWLLSAEEKAELQGEIDQAMDFVRSVIAAAQCDILILDEIFGAMTNRLVSQQAVLDLLAARPAAMEVILTGRDAPAAIVEQADLVTEMREIKHYFNKGVQSRTGIED